MTAPAPTPSPRYIVKTSSAQMPASVRSPYRHVAVMLVTDPSIVPRMISCRARNVIRIHAVWRRQHAKGADSAYVRALRAAEEMADRLNTGLCEKSRTDANKR